MNLRRLFTEHPQSVGETYFQHLRSAWSFSGSMLLGALSCFIHGLLPFVCVGTASLRIAQLYQRMVTNRSANPTADRDRSRWSAER